MLVNLSKNMLVNSGFVFVGKNKVNDNQIDYIFNYELVSLNSFDNQIDIKEATYKFNKLFEYFKHDIKEIEDQTGVNYRFKVVGNDFIISELW